jgi:hypothetical protein
LDEACEKQFEHARLTRELRSREAEVGLVMTPWDMAAKQSATALGIQKIAETPTLTEIIESFDPDRHGGEVMVTEPVGAEEG